MYIMMSTATQADMPKPKFVNTYGIMSNNIGRLSSFTVKEAIPNDDDIIVKAELTFAKQKPPTGINGVHNFHLVKENWKWKIKTIVPLISPPNPIPGHRSGGSHPGE